MRITYLLSTTLACVALGFAGCDSKDEVIDIEAPGVGIEVDEDGETRVDVDD